MSSHNRATLPVNPSLKDINWYKKQINWGELPPFYHLVASSVSEAESVLDHGFDNAIKRMLDKRNWNIELLGGEVNSLSEITCENPPRIALYQLFTDRGFELHAFPLAKDKEIDQYVKDNRFMEFIEWDPYMMKVVLRINQLNTFIQFYFQRGDEADKALILHSHKVVHKTIEFLKTNLNVVKVSGVSIKDYYMSAQKLQANCQDELELAQILVNEFRGTRKE